MSLHAGCDVCGSLHVVSTCGISTSCACGVGTSRASSQCIGPWAMKQQEAVEGAVTASTRRRTTAPVQASGMLRRW
eukprot:3762024-Prymnesium_polylepis.1